MKYTWRNIVGNVLATAVLISSLGIPAAAAEPKTEKSETVYVITDAAGLPGDVIVSDWLKNLDGKDVIRDSSNLKDITTVKGDAVRDGSGTNLSWTTGGSDVYYQGTAEKDLPVGVEFTYRLDGKTIAPEELAGKSGKLTIEIRYTNNEKQTVTVNGAEETVYVPFLMVTGLLMNSDKVENVTVDHGVVQNDGSRTIVVGYGMPGLSESLKLDEMVRQLQAENGKTIEEPELPETVTVSADVRDLNWIWRLRLPAVISSATWI